MGKDSVGSAFRFLLFELGNGCHDRFVLGLPFFDFAFEFVDSIALSLAGSSGAFSVSFASLLASPCSSFFLSHGDIGIIFHLGLLSSFL